MEKAKKFLIGSYALRFDTSTKIAGHLQQLQREGFDAGYLDRRNAEVAAVTLEDARRVAKADRRWPHARGDRREAGRIGRDARCVNPCADFVFPKRNAAGRCGRFRPMPKRNCGTNCEAADWVASNSSGRV